MVPRWTDRGGDPPGAAADASGGVLSRGQRIRRKRLMKATVTLALLALPAYLCVYRIQYGTFSPFDPPRRFDYCGGSFHGEAAAPEAGPGGALDGAEAADDAGTGRLVYAFTIRPAGWRVYAGAPVRCLPGGGRARLLFLMLGPDRYLEFAAAD